jgi:hypothetical protein
MTSIRHLSLRIVSLPPKLTACCFSLCILSLFSPSDLDQVPAPQEEGGEGAAQRQKQQQQR